MTKIFYQDSGPTPKSAMIKKKLSDLKFVLFGRPTIFARLCSPDFYIQQNPKILLIRQYFGSNQEVDEIFIFADGFDVGLFSGYYLSLFGF